MNDLAIHLVDEVLPFVPMRHWVCTVPWSLRARMGYDREACAALVHAFTGAPSRLQRHRAKEQLGLRSVSEAHTGAVTFIQRSDSALRLGDHVHMLISIPPKHAVAQVVGYIKGKSAIHIARTYGERKRNFVGQHFWARGYFVSTVGRDEGVVRDYIRHQEAEDRRLEQLRML